MACPSSEEFLSFMNPVSLFCSRYRSPGESPQTSPNFQWRRVSGCGYGLGIQQHADLAAEKIKKDLDPLAVRHAIINSETVIKCAFQNPNLVTGFEFRPMIELDESCCVFTIPEEFDDPFRDRRRKFAVTNEARNTNGRINRAPALRGHIDFDEKIAGEQRRGDNVNTPRVPSTFEVARQIGCKPLASQMYSRFILGIRLRLDDVPLRPAGNSHFVPSSF